MINPEKASLAIAFTIVFTTALNDFILVSNAPTNAFWLSLIVAGVMSMVFKNYV